MAEKEGPQQQGEQFNSKLEKGASKQFKDEAKKSIKRLTKAAKKLTSALGLPPEDMFEVLHMVYSDRFLQEDGEAKSGQGRGKEVFNRETARDKNSSENNL